MSDILGGSGSRNLDWKSLLPLLAYFQSGPQGQGGAGGFLGGQNLQSLIALMLLMQRLNPSGTTPGAGTRPTLTGISPKNNLSNNSTVTVAGGSFSPDVELALFGPGCPDTTGCGY